ncbi:luc7-like protein 3 isoform X2 [Coregonus clupeaformis]|uniref:luc7-like protein 3 isoform X2 n=1 Tax=Coregonus clupeaformis TaxID=59861 RepID=UPI001E1C5FA6|nr:luc7-like protein 3 isoform X2 [Coregonus clupeaformis]
MLSAAQLLDELMGRDRNLAPDEKRCNVRWDHETTCKYYLCGFCPAELFTNTRSDLGPCEKIHDENLRKMYEKSSRFMKEGYERDFLRYLQSLLAEVERRIRRGHARLALSQAQQAAGQGPGGPVGKNEEKATVLTEKIEDLVMQIEELGSEGRVEEAQGMMKLVEQLKDERELLSSTPSTIETFAAQEKQMEVCEVCGAFLIVGDAQSRVDDHLMGKQHMGYAKIKSTVEELKKLHRRSEDPAGEEKGELESKDWEREREERESKRKLEEEEKEKEKEKEREKEKEKERERVKEREREREKRGRRSHSNSRHSSRASDRKRSRSRERRRSRSKEKERKRSRSRDRDRERRRSRERSDRKRHSRSRERKRSRSSERKSHRHRSRSREKDRTSRDKERKEPEERRSSSKKDEVLDDDKPSSDVAKAEPMEAEAPAPASTLGLALLARVNGAAQHDLHSEGDTQSN